jgi:hypothetical protein
VPWTEMNIAHLVLLLKILSLVIYNTENFLTTVLHFNSNKVLNPLCNFCWFEAKHISFSTSSVFHLLHNFNFIIILFIILSSIQKRKAKCLHTSVDSRNNWNIFFSETGDPEAFISLLPVKGARASLNSPIEDTCPDFYS